MNKLSLRDRIKIAPNRVEAERLMNIGRTYKFVSNSTRNKWIKAFDKRCKELVS